MKQKSIISVIFFALLIYACKRSLYTPADTSGRQIKPNEVVGYHTDVNMRIAWYPYKDLTLKQKSDNTWVVVKNDNESKQGNMPVILLDYNRQDSIWIDMNTDNETLGKLIKHTLMTEEPITKPYNAYFEIAKCSKCHPSEIDKGF